MSRQKSTSALLVFALAGVMIGCETSQQERTPMSATRRPTALPSSRPMRPMGTPATVGDVMEEAPKTTRTSAWPTHHSGGGMTWIAVADPTGDPRTSVIGMEKGFPSELRAGQPFDYQIVVTNLTGRDVSDVVILDDPSENLTLVSSSPRGRVIGGDITEWNLGTFGPHESKTIRVNGNPRGEGAITTCTEVTFNSVLCATVPVVSPKLRLTKAGPAEVLSCDMITYTFEVANTGTGSISNVRINDPLPAGLVSATGGRTVSFDAGTLAAGSSKKFSSTVRAERSGRFENSATATGEGGMTAASGTVVTTVREPKLEITKSCSAQQFVGRTIEYTITVTNSGDGMAVDTVITDPIPANATFVSASDGGRNEGGRVVWNVGTLRPRDSKRVTMRVSPAGTGAYRNTATATCSCPDDTVSDSCQTEVTGIPAILLEVIDLEDPDEVGTTETYVITVTNQGSADDTNILVVNTLEPNQEYVSSSGPTTGTARGNVITFQPLRVLPPKQQAVWRVTVRNVKAGDVRFTTSMTSDMLTRKVEETEATNVYE